jgi:hypothetical protein
MDLNADFSQRVVIHSDQLTWQTSPMPDVDRRMLDSIECVPYPLGSKPIAVT